jgi:hypothetical protein
MVSTALLLTLASFYLCTCEEITGSCPSSDIAVSARRLCASPRDNSNGRVAVAFFGISRGLKYTLPSIQRHVFDVLDRSGIDYDVFWHTVSTSAVNNLHANENISNINEFDAMLMRPCRVSIVDQDVVAAQEFDKYCRAKKAKCSKARSFDSDPTSTEKYAFGLWSEAFGDTRNRLNSLHTQREVYTMIREHMSQYSIHYDGIIALRPDMAPITHIDLPLHISALRELHNTHTIWVPDFQPFRGYNDRAAWGSVAGMAVYLQRGKEYRDNPSMPSSNSLHSERFLKAYLDHKEVPVNEVSTFRSVRVRADGCVDRMDTWHMNLKSEEDKAWLQGCFREVSVVKENGRTKECPVLVMGNSC